MEPSLEQNLGEGFIARSSSIVHTAEANFEMSKAGVGGGSIRRSIRVRMLDDEGEMCVVAELIKRGAPQQ